ncbi:hypothetical protein ANO11243_074190 [Dothideomycetidae sp. 11243]|nr:hypothetical protein ANO11243_074190 [fungal sp. No.11243]
MILSFRIAFGARFCKLPVPTSKCFLSTRWIPKTRYTFIATRSLSAFRRYPLFEALVKHDPGTTAVIHSLSGREFTYGQLVNDILRKATQISAQAGVKEDELRGERIALLIENSYDYVVNLLAIIACDAIAVPLSPTFPVGELQYVLDHSEALMLLSSAKFEDKAKETLKEGLQHTPIYALAEKSTPKSAHVEPPPIRQNTEREQGGLMLYTSGTTSRPKGVLLPTSSLNAQCLSLKEAWTYSTEDRLLHILPLHHIHGVVNAILTPLLAGSSVEFLYPFSPNAVWSRFAEPFLSSPFKKPITFFTAVPTVYSSLLATYAQLPLEIRNALETALHPSVLRLNISGSAALPTPTKAAWTQLTKGNILLERYGMTEVGMAISCGLPFSSRPDASVGWPLPSVEARLASLSDPTTILPPTSHSQGEIHLRAPTIFKEYWRNPSDTAAAFTEDGWFRTGDVAVRRPHPARDDWAWHVLGRASMDMLKSGGELVSALEIEREILSLPDSPVVEVAVVGVPSERWGQSIVAVAKTKDKGYGVMDLRRALKGRMARHKLPRRMCVVEQIPRNAMGKVNKKELVRTLFRDGTAGQKSGK